MNSILSYNRLIAIIMLALYLFLPLNQAPHAFSLEAGPTAMLSSVDTDAPCSDCPCSSEHDSGCNGTLCPCASHIPPLWQKPVGYTPVISSLPVHEPSWSLPHIYRAIFVPPQNRA